MAQQVNENMAIEVKDLVERRRLYLDTYRKEKELQ
jgi:hypothetical protein